MRYSVLLLVLAAAVPSFGQVSQDEAAARLKQKAAERAAASQPNEDAQRAIRTLQQQVSELRAALDRLQKDNETLRKALAAAQTELAHFQPAQAAAGGQRPAAVLKAIADNEFVVGMTKDEADRVMRKAGYSFSQLPTNSDVLVQGKAVHQEEWKLNRIRRNTLHFTDGLLDEVSD